MVRGFLATITLIVVLYGILYVLTPETTPPQNTMQATSTALVDTASIPDVSVIAEHLNVPWDIAFLPDSSLLVTERAGVLLHLNPITGASTSIVVSTEMPGEGGLLGVVLHPNFARNNYLYLYMSTPSSESKNETQNKIVRYTFSNDALTEDMVIISGIPGAAYHDGGRIEFGPDGKLYVTTGDATRSATAQDNASLEGKILRLNDDGSVPADNPYGNAVWSSGHRNPQGLAWDISGRLWSTEHGPSGEHNQCCHDELNLITKGANYGWPTIIGSATKTGLVSPIQHSGSDTWAPASLLYYDGSLYFGALKGNGLYEAKLENDTVSSLTLHLENEFGRIRTVRLGPDDMFYITTSNTDGRGTPLPNDDRIVRIRPASLR